MSIAGPGLQRLGNRSRLEVPGLVVRLRGAAEREDDAQAHRDRGGRDREQMSPACSGTQSVKEGTHGLDPRVRTTYLM